MKAIPNWDSWTTQLAAQSASSDEKYSHEIRKLRKTFMYVPRFPLAKAQTSVCREAKEFYEETAYVNDVNYETKPRNNSINIQNDQSINPIRLYQLQIQNGYQELPCISSKTRT